MKNGELYLQWVQKTDPDLQRLIVETVADYNVLGVKIYQETKKGYGDRDYIELLYDNLLNIEKYLKILCNMCNLELKPLFTKYPSISVDLKD